MVDWQEVIALAIVASTACLLLLRAFRQWSGEGGGCGGCGSCASENKTPKAVPSAIAHQETTSQLLQIDTAHADRRQ